MYNHNNEDQLGGIRKDRTMRGARPLGRTTLAVAIAIALVVGALGGTALGVLLRPPVVTPAPNGTEYLFLTIGFDYATGLDRYMPANFTVPTHTPVLVTITNYDNASNFVSNASTTVFGTVGNTETMRSSSDTQGMVMGSVPANRIAHTFTLSDGPYSINVPVAAAASRGDPMIVTFTAYFNVTGTFTWHCMASCDPASMLTSGYMQGTVTVVDT